MEYKRQLCQGSRLGRLRAPRLRRIITVDIGQIVPFLKIVLVR